MNISLNQQVLCRFTESGREVYQAYLDQFSNQPLVLKEAPAEATMPLWKFAQIFGNVLFNGQIAAPFTVDNVLELVG